MTHLTREQIRDRALAFVAAIKADDEEAGVAAIVDLAINTLIDLRRIADALEKLAEQPHQHFHPGPGQKLAAVGDRVVIDQVQTP